MNEVNLNVQLLIVKDIEETIEFQCMYIKLV